MTWLGLLWAGCGLMAPELPPLVTDPQLVTVPAPQGVATEADLPTGLVARPDGVLWLVGGLAQPGVALTSDGVAPVSLPAGALRGTSVGAEVWLALPDLGQVVRTDAEGRALERLDVRDDEGPLHPVSVLVAGEALLVGCRTGELVRFVDGAIDSVRTEDVDGLAFGSLVDLAPLADGRVLAADALGSKVHLLDADGTPRAWFGHTGPWVGSLLKPKAVLAGPGGTVLVADSAQGSVQLFEVDGTALGAVAVAGEALRLGHAIDLAPLDGGFAVLDARSGEVHRVMLGDAAVQEAREAARVRHLRTTLVGSRVADADGDQKLCFQCHDGLAHDAREVWDPRLEHHPVGVVADLVDVPDAFPLDAEGRLRCATCHSPHGLSSLDEVAQEATGVPLVRHASGAVDLFLRSRVSESSLCIGCHTDAAHDRVVASVGLPDAGAHPVGAALAAALAKRGGSKGSLGLPEGVDGSCLSCHAVHGAAAGALQRGLAEGGTCLGCHEPQQGRGHHDLVAEGVDGGPGACLACHDVVGGRTSALMRWTEGGDACQACHTDVTLGGAHATLPGHREVPCLACHAPHEGAGDALLAAVARPRQGDAAGCRGCHQGTFGRVGHPVRGAVAACTGCHASAHGPDQVEACQTCHADAAAAETRGGHGGMSCEGCHPPHEATPTYAGGRAGLNPASRRCLSCHAPGQGGSAVHVAAIEHPAPMFLPDGARWKPLGDLPLYGDDGRQVGAGDNGDLVCQSCHEVHGPHEARPAGKLRRPEWREACSACHGQDALPLYQWFHAPERRAGLLEGR